MPRCVLLSLGIRSLDSSSRRKKSTLGGLGFGLCRSLMQGCSSSPSRSPSIWFPCALGGPLECLSPTRCSIQTGLGASVERQRPCRCLHQTHMQPVPLPRPPSRSRDSSTNASPGRKFVASLPRCHALQGPLAGACTSEYQTASLAREPGPDVRAIHHNGARKWGAFCTDHGVVLARANIGSQSRNGELYACGTG